MVTSTTPNSTHASPIFYQLLGGEKFDTAKLRYDLIPAFPLQELARLYGQGADKYGDWNWAEGIAWSRIYAALLRHLQAWIQGGEYDAEGQHHLDSVAWCAFTLRQYVDSGIGEDDRHIFSSKVRLYGSQES